MTALLELRQKISEVYGRYEAYVRICTKCLLAFLVFYMIHSQLSGSMNPRSWAEIVVATLIAVMIPIDACSILVAIFVIVHMLMISVEAGVIAAAFFLFLLLTYFIFKPRQSILITVMCLVGMLNRSDSDWSFMWTNCSDSGSGRYICIWHDFDASPK